MESSWPWSTSPEAKTLKRARLIEPVRPRLEKAPLNQQEWTRWPELVLADRAIRRPAIRAQAIAIAEALAVRTDKEPPIEAERRAAPRTLWKDQVQNLRARATLLNEDRRSGANPARTADSELDLAPWAQVTPSRDRTRGEGEPIPRWTVRGGEYLHHPGHANDLDGTDGPLATSSLTAN